MAAKNKNLKPFLYGDLTPRQEMDMLRDNWSLVLAADGTWRILATTTITAPPGREASINMLRYAGVGGVDIYSITNNEELGPTYYRHSLTRTLGFLGSKTTLDVLAVNRQGVMSYDRVPEYAFGTKILTLDPGQTVKAISKDSMPMIPVAETKRLATMALCSPEEYASAFIVQQVMNVENMYSGLLATNAGAHTEYFPAARCTTMSFTTVSAGAV